jgi:thiamine biosynthesis lipoprotein
VGKGYVVDAIYNTLSKHNEAFVINFGGDIRIKGNKKVMLEDPYDDSKAIGSIDLHDIAIASSNGNKRKTQHGHHLINPKTKKSQNDKIALYVTHKLATFADIFSTALFVTPLELSLKILEQTPGLEALIIESDGTMHKSR